MILIKHKFIRGVEHEHFNYDYFIYHRIWCTRNCARIWTHVFAKRAGIMCPEFAIGMGPKILVFVKMKHYIQFVYYRWVVMSEWLVMVLKNHQFNQV